MTLLLAALAALGSLLLGGRLESAPAPVQVTEVAPAAKLVVLDLVIDLEGLGREVTKAEQRALLEAAEKVLVKRLPAVKIFPADDKKTGNPYLRLRAPEAAGFTRERLIELATAAGDLSFQAEALSSDLKGEDTSLDRERERVESWRKQHPASPLSRFSSVADEDGGPHPLIRWAWKSDASDAAKAELVPLLRETNPDWCFDSADMESFWSTEDQVGQPALGFGIEKDRQAAFKALTAHYVGRKFAIVVGDRILTAPVIHGPLEAGGVITGGSFGFSQQAVDDLVTVLQNPHVGARLAVVAGSPK